MTELQITAIEYLTKGRVNIHFENEETLLLYRSEIYKLPRKDAELLTAGTYIPQSLYHKLLYEVIGVRAKKRAIYLLEQMDRTKKQLSDKLMRGGYPKICVEEAVAYVERYRYLDDERYARMYVRCGQDKKSMRRITIDLTAKGVAREVIEQALEEEYTADETEKIRQLLEKRHYDYQGRDQKEKQRTYQYLMRRGFHSSDILKVLRAQ